MLRWDLFQWNLQAELWFGLVSVCGIQSSPRQSRHRSQSFYTNSPSCLAIDDLQFSECSITAWRSSATALCESRLAWGKGGELFFPHSAWRINNPTVSKSVGTIHILCKIIWIQNGHRELSKITQQGSSNKKLADEQNGDFFFFLVYQNFSF